MQMKQALCNSHLFNNTPTQSNFLYKVLFASFPSGWPTTASRLLGPILSDRCLPKNTTFNFYNLSITDMTELPHLISENTLSRTVASLGGGGGGGERPLRVSPFYNVFVIKTFYFNLLGLNPHTQRKPAEFSAKIFFFFWSSLTFKPKTH